MNDWRREVRLDFIELGIITDREMVGLILENRDPEMCSRQIWNRVDRWDCV